MLTTEEAAKKLGLSVSCLESWRRRGSGPIFVKFGKAIRYPEERINEFEKACEVSTCVDMPPCTKGEVRHE